MSLIHKLQSLSANVNYDPTKSHVSNRIWDVADAKDVLQQHIAHNKAHKLHPDVDLNKKFEHLPEPVDIPLHGIQIQDELLVRAEQIAMVLNLPLTIH